MTIYSGHAPGHVRETALEAFEQWQLWDDQLPEPTVTFEVNYEPREIPISQALRMVWNCSDIVPGYHADDLAEVLPFRSRTYAGIARAIIAQMKQKGTL